MLRDNFNTIIITIFIIYFLLCDYHLYETIQNESNLNITITVKTVMIDHVNLYILHPLTVIFIELTNLPNHFEWLQANHVSYLGVLFALLASKLIMNDHLYVRRFGCLAYFFRQFMDDLDGYIARNRLGIDANKQVSVTNSSGYIVDGLCDAIGIVVFSFALFLYSLKHNKFNSLSRSMTTTTTTMTTSTITKTTTSSSTSLTSNGQNNNNNNNKSTYVLLCENDKCDDDDFYDDVSSSASKSLTKTSKSIDLYQRNRLIKQYVTLLVLHFGYSAFAWNIFLNQYHYLIDPNLFDGFARRTVMQENIFKSYMMTLITFLWRIFNPHSFTNYLLIAIYLNKHNEWLQISNRYVFYLITCLSIVCIVHLKRIDYCLNDQLTLF